MNKSISVLIVEDEHLLLNAISKKLAISGIEAIECGSGEHAIETLAKLERMPDVIWLDYHLKGMDGMEFMSELKKKDAWTKIPVIVVSNSASSDKVYGMLALGAKKYLLKAEHRLDDIIESVRQLANEK